ncbi:MAG: ABC transporter ATP-binding protein [Caldilineaceae bacterium]
MHHAGWRALIVDDPEKRKRKIDRKLVARVFTYARPHAASIGIVLVAIIIVSLLGLIPPLLYRSLIDNVLPNGNVRQLNLLALAMLTIPVISGMVSVVQRYFSAKAGEGIIYDLRQSMYQHLQHMSLRFFTATKSGEIVSRFNNDVVGAQNAVTGTVPDIVTNLVTLVSTLAIMISIEWRLTVLAVLVLPLFLLPARRVARVLRDIRRKAMDYNADMSSIVSETLSVNGALLVKTFGAQRRETKRFGSINGNVRDIGVRRAQVSQVFFLGLSLAATIGTALIYWAGGYMVIGGAITVGTIVAFAAYLTRLYGPITSLTNMQVEFAQAMVSFERVFEYLDMPVEIADLPEAVPLDDVDGWVEFDGVWFQYLDMLGPRNQSTLVELTPEQSGVADEDEDADGEGSNAQFHVPTRLWAIEDVSFQIEPGQLVALVGPSGAGKTTITYLLPRLYDPTQGAVRLDGVDLRETTQESIANQIGMVTQETYLFHDTIRANLLYARPDATQEELEMACRAANIHDMIADLPDGYDTVVGERGYRLSGGEKQRISIARVILKNPRILVLDEATSHLDSQNEALIQNALEPLFEGRTSIVIAHRLSTILAADKILVMDRGRLVESGTHTELLAQGGLYAELYETQFRADALVEPG